MTVRRVFVIWLVVVAAGGAAAPVAAAVDFVGSSGRVALGVVGDRQGVVAYVCDGRHLGHWFRGGHGLSATTRLRAGAYRLTLKMRSRTGTATLRGGGLRKSVRLAVARGRAGLYRADSVRAGRRRIGGWVVLRSGRQVGAVGTRSGVIAAPKLSTSSLGAGDLVAGRVIASTAPEMATLDLAGDGVGPNQKVVSALAGGIPRVLDWPAAGDDDEFLAVSVPALRALGFKLADAAGGSIGDVAIVRSGLKVTSPSGVTTTTSDAFQLLRILDQDGDGRLTVRDPARSALLAYADRNGDGRVGLGETSDAASRVSAVIDALTGNNNDLTQELAFELQTIITRLATATQQKSAIFAKDSAAKSAVVANIRG